MRKLQIKKLRSTTALAVATVGVAIVGVFASVSPASAAAGNVKIQFGNWHCPSGGSVIFINGINVTPSGNGAWGVNGSTASVGVIFNTQNVAYGTITCHYQPHWYMPWYWVNVPVSIYGQAFWPTTAGQTFHL